MKYFFLLSICLFVLNVKGQNTFPNPGNVGIGTTSPEVKLHIAGSGMMFKIENSDGTINQYAQMNLKAGTADNYIWTNNQNSSGFYGGSAALNLYTGQNSPIAFFTAGSNERMRISGAGDIGIGTASPEVKLHITGNGKMFKIENTDGTSNQQFAQMNLKAGTADNYIWTNNQNSPGFYGGSSSLNIYTGQNSPIAFFTNNNERMRIEGSGNIGIGTTSPDSKLTVKGKIHAEEVKVDLTVPGPDYVFEKKYALKPLSEVEIFISQNKHLPEIPSAKTMKDEGINVGEMQMKLLQKIEEITLYLIEMKKENVQLKDRVKELENKR